MPDITDRELISFCNERIRIEADLLAQAYSFGNVTLDVWNANGYSSSIPNDSSEIKDGADVDGRPVITGQDVHNIMNRISELKTDYELLANSKRNTVLAVSPHPDRRG